MPREKVFAYLVRKSPRGVELLVLESHDEPGFEVPKGSVDPGESPRQAVQRELLEEAGIGGVRIVRQLGEVRWQNERQHFFLLRAEHPQPDRFVHEVTGTDGDRGLQYRYRWLAVSKALSLSLVQGCGQLVDELVNAIVIESMHF